MCKLSNLVALFLLCGCVSVSGNSQTETTNARGKAVVDAVLRRFKTSNYETDPVVLQFLCRIACVESNFGNDPNTFRAGYYGGIWQVDRKGFMETKNYKSHPNITIRHIEVKTAFGITWIKIPWKECRKPLYSALAARLFLNNIPDQIPSTIQAQAAYWKQFYNTACGAGTVKEFKMRVDNCEQCEKYE